MTLVWEKVTSDGGAPVAAYVIEAKKCGEDDFHEIASVSASELTYSATELQADTEYEFAVKAQNVAGTSEEAAVLAHPVKTKVTIGGSLQFKCIVDQKVR